MMALKRREAKPERNSKPSLTIPARTRSPMEAFQMLNAGQPIDLVAGYYEKDGKLPKDFHLMDKIEKLSLLSELRQQKIQAKAQVQQILNHYKQIEDEKQKSGSESAAHAGSEAPKPGGTTVPQ